MNNYLVLIALIGILILVLGLIGFGAIILAAHRRRGSSDNKKAKPTDHSKDPWQEAGRRQQ